MKWSFRFLIVSFFLAGVSHSATLTFTNAGATQYATGFGDAGGNIAFGLIWGVVVDTSGDGFATSNWKAGFTYTGGTGVAGIALVNSLGVMTDDVLFINATVTSNLASAADGAAAGVGRVNSINSVDYNLTPVSYNSATGTAPTTASLPNKNFAIIWFDRGIALGETSISGQKFGLATVGTNVSPAFTTLGDNSNNIDFSAAFAGADPVKSATFTLIPEPSTLLLSSLGVFGLLRRRR